MEYRQDGSRDTVLEQYFWNEGISFTRRCFWRDPEDKRALLAEATALGFEVRHSRDLHTLSNLYTSECAMFYLPNAMGNPIAIRLDTAEMAVWNLDQNRVYRVEALDVPPPKRRRT